MNSLKVVTNLNILRNSIFSSRMADKWNELDETIAMAASVDDFKIDLSTVA